MKRPWPTLVFGLLAILGVALPWYFNLQFLASGESPLEFLRAGFANPAVASVTVDILIASTAFLIWMIVESRRLGMRNWWIYIVLTFSLAFAFAFPLFLMMRERKLRELERLV
jgi:hypothetical protein